MYLLTRKEMIEAVKAIMEELIIEPLNIDTLASREINIDTYINKKIVAAINWVYNICPQHLCNIKDFININNHFPHTDGSGIIYVDRMQRLIEFKMQGWERPIREALSVSDPRYRLQFNRHTRGGVAKPLCFIKRKLMLNEGADAASQDKTIIEYFSLPPHTIHKIETLKFSANISENYDTFEMNELLIDPAAYQCASLVYEILGNAEMAALMGNRAIKMVQDLNNL